MLIFEPAKLIIPSLKNGAGACDLFFTASEIIRRGKLNSPPPPPTFVLFLLHVNETRMKTQND